MAAVDARVFCLRSLPEMHFCPTCFARRAMDFSFDGAKPGRYERAMINNSTHRWHDSQLGFVTGARPYTRGGALLG
jgi:hypothetical protein